MRLSLTLRANDYCVDNAQVIWLRARRLLVLAKCVISKLTVCWRSDWWLGAICKGKHVVGASKCDCKIQF
ncbi:MAG: hypothetical protein HCTETUND1_165 [Candidatus Hodgkinia cicadicola]|nr:MAG: hypothetical protein HCTETUND1_165 [Candidatus Hodgkinia cicadicola]